MQIMAPLAIQSDAGFQWIRFLVDPQHSTVTVERATLMNLTDSNNQWIPMHLNASSPTIFQIFDPHPNISEPHFCLIVRPDKSVGRVAFRRVKTEQSFEDIPYSLIYHLKMLVITDEKTNQLVATPTWQTKSKQGITEKIDRYDQKQLHRWDPEPNIKADIQRYFLIYQHQDLTAEAVSWKNSDLVLQKPADVDTRLSLSQQGEVKLCLRTDWLQLKQNSTDQAEYIQALIYILTGVINDHLNEFSLETQSNAANFRLYLTKTGILALNSRRLHGNDDPKITIGNVIDYIKALILEEIARFQPEHNLKISPSAETEQLRVPSVQAIEMSNYTQAIRDRILEFQRSLDHSSQVNDKYKQVLEQSVATLRQLKVLTDEYEIESFELNQILLQHSTNLDEIDLLCSEISRLSDEEKQLNELQNEQALQTVQNNKQKSFETLGQLKLEQGQLKAKQAQQKFKREQKQLEIQRLKIVFREQEELSIILKNQCTAIEKVTVIDRENVRFEQVNNLFRFYGQPQLPEELSSEIGTALTGADRIVIAEELRSLSWHGCMREERLPRLPSITLQTLTQQSSLLTMLLYVSKLSLVDRLRLCEAKTSEEWAQMVRGPRDLEYLIYIFDQSIGKLQRVLFKVNKTILLNPLSRIIENFDLNQSQMNVFVERLSTLSPLRFQAQQNYIYSIFYPRQPDFNDLNGFIKKHKRNGSQYAIQSAARQSSLLTEIRQWSDVELICNNGVSYHFCILSELSPEQLRDVLYSLKQRTDYFNILQSAIRFDYSMRVYSDEQLDMCFGILCRMEQYCHEAQDLVDALLPDTDQWPFSTLQDLSYTIKVLAQHANICSEHRPYFYKPFGSLRELKLSVLSFMSQHHTDSELIFITTVHGLIACYENLKNEDRFERVCQKLSECHAIGTSIRTELNRLQNDTTNQSRLDRILRVLDNVLSEEELESCLYYLLQDKLSPLYQSLFNNNQTNASSEVQAIQAQIFSARDEYRDESFEVQVRSDLVL